MSSTSKTAIRAHLIKGAQVVLEVSPGAQSTVLIVTDNGTLQLGIDIDTARKAQRAFAPDLVKV